MCCFYVVVSCVHKVVLCVVQFRENPEDRGDDTQFHDFIKCYTSQGSRGDQPDEPHYHDFMQFFTSQGAGEIYEMRANFTISCNSSLPWGGEGP